MKTYRIPSIVLIIVVLLPLLLSACSPTDSIPGITTSNSTTYVLWNPTDADKAALAAFKSQSKYTGMTDEEMEQYFWARYVDKQEMTLAEAQQKGLIGASVMAVPVAQFGEVGLPSIGMAGPAGLTALFGSGVTVALLVTQTDTYKAKMAAIATVPPTTLVVYIHSSYSHDKFSAIAQGIKEYMGNKFPQADQNGKRLFEKGRWACFISVMADGVIRYSAVYATNEYLPEGAVLVWWNQDDPSIWASYAKDIQSLYRTIRGKVPGQIVFTPDGERSRKLIDCANMTSNPFGK